MGRRTITRRRGRGGPRYQVPSFRFEGGVNYPQGEKYSKGIGGQVISIDNDPARTAPVAKILLEDFSEIRLVASEGMKVGQWVAIGGEAKQEKGNALQLGNISEGTLIYNIELTPGDGGKIVRASGGAAAIVSHDREKGITLVKLPSKKTREIPSKSLASIGIVAGGGRQEKPMVRAGQNYHRHKARNKLYPRVRGVAMNAQNHPHGGGSHGYTGRPSSVARNTPPGRKVGMIAPSRTGRRKR
jgi:large subunit ribosomal protein L2